MNKKLKKLIFKFLRLILFCLLLNNFSLANIQEYLYCIEKIYYENLFIDREIYSLSYIQKYFLYEVSKLNNEEEALKKTLYKFCNDPYLEIKDKKLLESSYYQDRSVESDIKLTKIQIKEINFYYICFLQISPNMASKYRKYLKENIDKDGVIIIDITGNNGGSLWSAAYFVSMFLKPNTYLFSVNFPKKDKIKTQNFYSSSDYGGIFEKNFIVILQDDTTASAAEVISGVLKKRAIIFGNLTYGKPFIQSIFDIENLSIIYTNSYLNFSLDLKPHDKIPPDFYLSKKEINKEFLLSIISKIYIILKKILEGG